jgi:putative ABC transport system permease protein
MEAKMGEFFRRIYYMLNRRKLEREMANDIEFHREMMGADYRKDFGNELRVREQSREAVGWMWLDHFAQDLRYGFRTLRNNPGFTLVAMLALGLGIGANTALFSVVYGVLLKPLPYAQGQELVVLRQRFAGTERTDAGFSVKEIADYRQQTKSLAQIEEFHLMSFILLGGQEPDDVRTGVVSAHFFDLLGIKPYLGRLFTDSDDKPGADAVLVLSYPYWQKRYGGDPNIIGRHFSMNDKVHTVIGVLPPIPQYPRENDVYMPTVACPFRSSADTIADRKSRMLRLFGRLKPDTNIEFAKTDLSHVAAGMQRANPGDYSSVLTADMEGLQKQLTQKVRPMLLILLATAGLVLLIACANVANLALARTMRREQELAVRAAMGASRGRLVRQLLTESTLLGLAGGLLGLLLASGSLDLLVRFVAGFTTRAAEVSISTPVLLFTLVVSIVTGLVFGSVPAFFQRLDLVNSLKEGTNTASAKSSRHTVRNVLVMGQVAMSFMLLIGAGLMIRSFVRLQHVKAGYDSDNVLTATVPLNFSKYRNKKTVGNFFDQVTQKLEGTAGIQAVAANSAAPLSAQGMRMTVHFAIENRPRPERGLGPEADASIVTPEAFRVLGVPLINGRGFTRQDTEDKPVVIISRSLARHYFKNDDPINQRIAVEDDDSNHWLTIVGVVGDVKQYGLEQEPVDTIYAPMTLSPNVGTLLVKTAGDPLNYVKQVRDAVYSVDPDQPITDVKTLDELRGDSIAATRLTSILLAMFAGLALAIAATGLSGVTALLVSQRTREIGIRMALGAQRASVLQMFVMQAMKVIVSGLVIGLVGALLGARLIQSLLFSTPPTDPLTFMGVMLLFVAVALIASYVPARRISRVSPLIALRSE